MKKFISGILVGCTITTGVATYAAGGKNINIVDNVKKIVINQREQFINNQTPPFTYNGSVYVPLKMISTALNMDINWEANTGTVYLGKKYEEAIGYWGRDIVDMVTSNATYNKSITYAYNDQSKSVVDATNQSHSNYLMFNGYGGMLSGEKYAVFALDGKYKSFKCKVGFTKDGNDYPVHDYLTTNVKILADDQLIYTATLLKGKYPKEVNLDISGAKTIKFVVDSEAAVSVGRKMAFFDGEFLK